MIINTIQVTIDMKIMNKKIIFILTLITVLTSCSIIPGMGEPRSFSSNAGTQIIRITPEVINQYSKNNSVYKISKGDKLSIVVYGQNEFSQLIILQMRIHILQSKLMSRVEYFFLMLVK